MARMALTILSLITFISAEGTGWASETLSGQPIVLDGDSLRLRRKVIGLYGIAAPGKSQTCLDKNGQDYPCGQVSAQALAARIANATVTCETRDADKHGRALAVCRKDKEDLSAWMVRRGHAVADRQAQHSYVAEEVRAWGKRRNLWAGVFEDPTRRKRNLPQSFNTVADVQPKAAASELGHLNRRLPLSPRP